MCVSSRRLFFGWKYRGPGSAENSQYSCWAVEAVRALLGLQLWRQPPVSGRRAGIWCHSSSNSCQRWSQQLLLALLHALRGLRAGLGFPGRWELWNYLHSRCINALKFKHEVLVILMLGCLWLCSSLFWETVCQYCSSLNRGTWQNQLGKRAMASSGVC